MKILAIFVDMLGADYLNLCNHEATKTKIDELLSKLGGCVYNNCFTPAPDTPRSSACMWSGVYPKKNGCNNRLKYPGNFLNRELPNLWNVLEECGYTFNIFLRKSNEKIGLLPNLYPDRTFDGTVEDFIEFADIDDNSFTFFYLPDLHTHIDIYGGTHKGLVKGTEFVAGILEKIINGFGKECFDYILMFSDHGFRMAGTGKKHLLDTDRVRTFMYMRKKNDKTLVFDEKLRSNLDVFPTICDLIGYKLHAEIEGVSLLKEGHPYVLLEDHNNFSVSLGQTIEHWGVVLGKKVYRLECSGQWDLDNRQKVTELQEYELLIKEKMSDYEENVRLYTTIHKYDALALNDKFSDGSPINYNYRKHRKRIKVILSRCKGIFAK